MSKHTTHAAVEVLREYDPDPQRMTAALVLLLQAHSQRKAAGDKPAAQEAQREHNTRPSSS